MSLEQLAASLERQTKPRKRNAGTCRVCGCTDNDCSGCIHLTGYPCTWVEPDLCSACAHVQNGGRL